MRVLTDHIVSGDQAVQLNISVTDEPGQGGANHEYLIEWTPNPKPKPTIAELEAILPTWQAAWKAHQGVATGAADLLQHLADNGVPYAAAIRQAILSTPGAIAEAEKWLPTVAWALNAFAPAATGISGDAPAVGPRIGRG